MAQGVMVAILVQVGAVLEENLVKAGLIVVYGEGQLLRTRSFLLIFDGSRERPGIQ